MDVGDPHILLEQLQHLERLERLAFWRFVASLLLFLCAVLNFYLGWMRRRR